MQGPWLSPNNWRILDAIRARDGAARSQLVKATGLSWGTVSNIVRDLRARKLLLPLDGTIKVHQTRTGPASELLHVNPCVGYFLGIDVGCKVIRTELIDFAFQRVPITVSSVQTGTDIPALLDSINTVLVNFLQSEPPDRLGKLMGVGFAWPGAVDTHRDVVMFGTNTPVRTPLFLANMVTPEQRDKFNGVAMVLENDTKCAALAEKNLGGNDNCAREDDPMVYVFVGTGVGSGIVIDGKLYRGSHNYSGELGHLIVNRRSSSRCGCGRYGCLEQEISEDVIVKRFIDEVHTGKSSHDVTLVDIGQEFARGNIVAKNLMADVGEWLGFGLSNLVNLLNPKTVVIGGSIGELYQHFSPFLIRTLSEYCWEYSLEDLTIQPSRIGPQAVALGAAIRAYYRWLLREAE